MIKIPEKILIKYIIYSIVDWDTFQIAMRQL